MQVLSGACCTDARLYTLRIKIGTSLPEQQAPAKARIVELTSGLPIRCKINMVHVVFKSFPAHTSPHGPLGWNE